MNKMSKNKAQSAEVTVFSNQMSVPDVMAALDAKIKSMKHIEETPYKTNGNLANFDDLRTETNISTLIKMYSSVSNREKAYNTAAEELGLVTYPMFTEGGTSADWKHDIKLRIQIIEHKDNMDKLKNYKDRMSKFMSEQDQKDILMKEMTEFLSQSNLTE